MSSEEQDDEEDEDEKEDLFNNWVRGAQGLQYLKEGLCDFVGEKVQQCRDNALLKITQTLPKGASQVCNSCTSLNLSPEHCILNKPCNRHNCIQKFPTNCYDSIFKGRRKCPNGICSHLYDATVNDHSTKDPLWKNTNPSSWCSDPLGWSYAKCFQTTIGPGTSAKDVDAADLLSIMIYNKQLHNYMSYSSIYPITSSPYYKAREIRNKIFHSPELKIDETALHSYLDTFIAVLEDPKYLLNDEASKEAVKKLIKLKRNTTSINQEDQKILFMNRNKALTELDEKTAEGLRELDMKYVTLLDDFKHDVAEITSQALSDIGKGTASVKQTTASKTCHTSIDLGNADTHAEQIQNPKAISDHEETEADKDAEKMAKQIILTKSKRAITQMKGTIVFLSEGYSCDMVLPIEPSSTIHKDSHELMTDIPEQDTDTIYKEEKGITKKKTEKYPGRIRKRFRFFRNIFSSPNRGRVQVPTEIRATISGLRCDLITYYQNKCNKLPLTPVFDNHTTPLAELFVWPTMHTVHLLTSISGRETKIAIKYLKEIFKAQCKETNREIYLTADSGIGKTALSKYIAMTWCQSYSQNDENRCFEKSDLDCMQEFELVFLVFLQDCSDGCSIDDYIHNQVIQKLSCYCTLPKDSLRKILHYTKHLIILDGLDEWNHPDNDCTLVPKSVPHRHERENFTILTTSRPWKLGHVPSMSYQVDLKIEMSELSVASAENLAQRAVSKIRHVELSQTRDIVRSFQRQIKEAELEDIERNPLLLLYSLIIWCETKYIGKSKCDLYGNIIELHLSRIEEKHGESEHLSIRKSNVPEYFSKYPHCSRHYMLLLSLGKLALQTLLCENSFVFDRSIAAKYLSESDIQLCLDSGILSESEVKTLTNKSYKISFSRKTLQEFFSAVCVCSQNTRDVQESILVHCDCLDNIIGLTTVFVFISKMNPALMSLISKRLVPVINNDETTRRYRLETRYNVEYNKPLEDLQHMYMACSRECSEHENLTLCLQDFFINEKCKQESYLKQLQKIVLQNKEIIASIAIGNSGFCSIQEMSVSLTIFDLQQIAKIVYYGEIAEKELVGLLVKPVQCLSIVPFNGKKGTQHDVEFCQMSSKMNVQLREL